MAKEKILTARRILSRERKAYQDSFRDFFDRMTVCHDKMLTEEERKVFHQWDDDRPSGAGTADWPGWEKHIGKPPWQRDKQKSSPKLVSIRRSP